jgi:outer membrane protein assembly factor BamE
MRLAVPLACAALVLGGCIYRIDIQQGNVVVQEQLARVKPGMSKAEVRQALGTPLLTDAFHANRWDYYFSNAKGGREIEKNRITVIFENDKVARVEGTAPPAIKGEERSK